MESQNLEVTNKRENLREKNRSTKKLSLLADLQSMNCKHRRNLGSWDMYRIGCKRQRIRELLNSQNQRENEIYRLM